MSHDNAGPRDIALLGAFGALVCCGLPVLLAIGGGVTIVGLGLRSVLLMAAGVVACGAGVMRWRQRSQGDTARRPKEGSPSQG